jgi:predicted deacylase
MRIVELGEGTPEVAVVGAIHGDEPCGARAVDRLAAEAPAVSRPVKLVVANEEALDRAVRYVDEDLNRAFPGDAEATSHERRLAHDLVRELRDCTTLALHSTQSTAQPFALVERVGAVARSVCPSLPVDVVVETAGFSEGRLVEHPHTVEVECGLQGTEAAAENAYDLARGFLAATGALARRGDGGTDAATGAGPVDDATGAPPGGVQVYRLLDPIPKEPAESYEVFVDNFERVEAGASFAAAGDDHLRAERSFYPVLLSAYGYEDIFGYAGEHLGTLD